jgi:hypothetical protein
VADASSATPPHDYVRHGTRRSFLCWTCQRARSSAAVIVAAAPWSSAGFSTDAPSRTLQNAGARGGFLDYVAVANEQPCPFRWTNTADEVLAGVERFCRRISTRETCRLPKTSVQLPSV